MTKQHKIKALNPINAIAIGLVCLFLITVIPLLCHAARSDASRMICARNLSTIGEAMLIYASDYDDNFPRAGGPKSLWTRNIRDWKAADRYSAYGLQVNGSSGRANITSCLYLMVKYAEVQLKTFVCPNDVGTTVFNPADDGVGNRDPITLWDFGVEPAKHCSYAYHTPFSNFALTTASDPNLAVAADRNPWIKSPFAEPKDFNLFDPNGSDESIKAGNSRSHKDQGQNVLLVDGRVKFENRPNCGIDNDNIYTSWNGNDKARGTPPKLGSKPANVLDSLLVNDPTIKPD